MLEDAGLARAAGLAIDLGQLEEMTGYTLTEAPLPAQPGGFGGFGGALNWRNPSSGVAKALQNARKGEGATDIPRNAETRPDALLRDFAADLSPAAGKIKSLLDARDTGRDVRDEARKLAEELPELMADDPAMAAVIEEAMAEAFAEGAGENTFLIGRAADKPPAGDASGTSTAGGEAALANEEGECRAKDPAHCPVHGTPEAKADAKADKPEGKDGEAKRVEVGSRNPDTPEVQAAQIEKANAAFAKCLETHEDVENAFSRGDIGNIDVRWGKSSKGLRHLVERRDAYAAAHPGEMDGRQTLGRMAETIVKGEVAEVTSKAGHTNVAIEHDGFRALLTRDREGGNHWVLSGYEISENGRGYHEKKARQG